MSIDGRGGDVGVTEQDLHHAGIDAVLQQPGRIAVAQAARGYPGDAGRLCDRRKGGMERVASDRPAIALIGEQPAWAARGSRWVRPRWGGSSSTGGGSGTHRSLLPLPITCRVSPVLSIEPTSSATA